MKTVILLQAVLLLGPCSYAQLRSGGIPAGRSLVLSRADSVSFSRNFFDGLKEKTLGNLDAALRYFTRCSELNPASDAVWYERAIIHYSRGENKEALDMIGRAISLNGEQAWYLGLKADILQKEKDFEEAVGTFDRLIRLQPGHIDHYFNKANALLALSRAPEALEVYRQIEGLVGPSEELTLERQRAYLENGDIAKAVSDINELIRQYPREVRFYLMRGELYDAGNRSRKALDSYKRALKIDPGNGYARLALADHYRTRGQKADSFEELKMAFGASGLNIDTKIKILLNNYIKSKSKPKPWAAAEELAGILIDVYPHDARAYAIYGDILLQQDKQTQARNAYREAVKYEKHTLLLWDQLLRLEISLDDFRGIGETSSEALRYFPEKVEFYLFSGVAKIQEKQYREAISTLQQGLSLADGKELKLQFYSNLGDAYHAVGNHEASDQAFDAALKLDRDNTLILNNYAYYLALREQHLERAEKMSRESITIEPENVSFHDTYAWVLYKGGNYREARKWIQKAVEAYPDSPTFLEHYGDILFRLGEKDLALEMWNRARELGARSGLLDKKIREKKLYE